MNTVQSTRSPIAHRLMKRVALSLLYVCFVGIVAGCADELAESNAVDLQPGFRADNEGTPSGPLAEPQPEQGNDAVNPNDATPQMNPEQPQSGPGEDETEPETEQVPVPGSDPDDEEQTLNSNMNCFGLIECLRPCGRDEACGQLCRERSSVEAVELIENLLACLRASGCAQDDGECQFAACGDEYDECVEHRNTAPETPAEPEPEVEPEPEPEPEVAVEVPGTGLICCGDAGAVCDVAAEYCCSTWFGMECKAECNVNLELVQSCDGAEDCAAGQVCCARADAVVPTSFASSCRAACEQDEQILNAGGACEVGGDEIIEPEPQPEPIEPGGEADEQDETNGPAEPGEQAPEMDGDCGLTFIAEARDASGPCIACTSGDNITVYAVIANPCEVPLSYRADRSCLASEFSIQNLESRTSAIYPASCRDEVRVEELAPGATVTQSRPAGRLSASRYELSVQFEDNERTLRTTTFSVE